jgi:hypothetical protein
MLEGLGDEPG